MVLRTGIDLYAVTWVHYCEMAIVGVAQANGVLVGISVAIFMSSAIANWLSQRATRQQQQAWHWWHNQRQQQQHTQAENVRDGLLQEAFALRRHLEKGSHLTDECAPYLDKFNQFYRSLENLSNELSPPFVEDSLPLALQFLLKHHGQFETSLDLEPDTDWSCDGNERNRTVISIVAELLPLLMQDDQAPLKVRLRRTGTVNNLQFISNTLDQNASVLLMNSAEVQYIKEIFYSLMSGTLDINQSDIELTCQLSWPTTSR